MRVKEKGAKSSNSTQVLVNRWPKAQETGLDSSSAMIKRAKHFFYPEQPFINFEDNEKHESETLS
jgi:trans-aconitate methyltransferase